MIEKQDIYKKDLSLNDLLSLINYEITAEESKIPSAIIRSCCSAIKKEFGLFPVLGVTTNYQLILIGAGDCDEKFIKRYENILLNIVCSWAIEGSLMVFGFSNINNPDIVVIPKHEWAFLIIDKERNSAFYEGKQYGNIKFVLSENNSAHELEKLTTEEKKSRKKLMPHRRETNSALILLYELFGHYKVKYLDELKAVTAWGRIVSEEFESEHIKSISDSKKAIILIDDVKLTKKDFLEKYRKRFQY